MKKLSEVCKLVGVTRRTLQEYDRINLLKPTAKTEGGYWLYDDSAIEKLMAIQIFVEAGYTRKAIKEISDSSTADLKTELDKVSTFLVEKRKRIEGLLNYIEWMKLGVSGLPSAAGYAWSKVDPSTIFRNKSFADYLNLTVNKITELDDHEKGIVLIFTQIYSTIIALSHLKDMPVNAKEVHECIEFVGKSIISYGAFESYDYRDDLPESVMIYIILSSIADNLDNIIGEFKETFREEISRSPIPLCDEETFVFIKAAIRQYLVDHHYIAKEYELEDFVNG